MSRNGNFQDWDYLVDTDDLTRAMSGENSECGVPGEAITAIAPFKDDTCILFGLTQTYVMAGDPAYGGFLDRSSGSLGCIGRTAWDYGPSGEVYFLSKNGLCIMDARGGQPVNLSENTIPTEMRGISTDERLGNFDVHVGYDPEINSVRVFIVPRADAIGRHWIFDLFTRGFYRIQHADFGCDPITLLKRNNRLYLGCKNGNIGFYAFGSYSDFGNLYPVECTYGPFTTGDLQYGGMLDSITIQMTPGSSPIQVFTYGANSAEDLQSSRGYRREKLISIPQLTMADGSVIADSGYTGNFLCRTRGNGFMIRVTALLEDPDDSDITYDGYISIDHMSATVSVMSNNRR
jgi:hypothetical protein